MNRSDYTAYLRSPEWQHRRARILARADGRCEWCGRFAGPNPHPWRQFCGDPSCAWCVAYFDEIGERNDLGIEYLEVHHKTYERLGHERDEDLAALCWGCHDAVTDRQWMLRDLQRAGLIDRADTGPAAAARRFWSILVKTWFRRRS